MPAVEEPKNTTGTATVVVPPDRHLPKNSNQKPLDPHVKALVRIVHWQGYAIVLLIAALAVSIFVRLTDLKIPNQIALTVPPPLKPSSIQTTQFVFQDGKLIGHGATVNKAEVQILGQILDYQEIKITWPDHALLVNGASMPIEDPQGSYRLDLALKPGPNVIDSAVRIDGQDYDRQQTVVYYGSSTSPMGLSTASTSTMATGTKNVQTRP